jgi:hypothetical protein
VTVRITVVDIPPGRTFEAFRIVRSHEAADPLLLDAFKSHYEFAHERRARGSPGI